MVRPDPDHRTGRPGAPGQAVRSLLVAAAVCLAAAMDGCGPKADVLDQDTHLGYTDLKRGGIAPLAAVTSEGEEDLREPLLRRFDAALRERKDLRVLRADDLRRAIGSDLHEDLAARFERSGRLRDADLALLDSLVGSKVRYVALARVEDQSVEQGESFDTDEETGATTTKRTATLRVRVAFSVYDLEAVQRVWDATITGSDVNSSSEMDEPTGLGGIIGRILGSIFGGNGSHEPEAPEADEALESIFHTFTKKLPAG